ncbi:MAG: hypothetical protein CMO44_12890 [Verrucomicrobiales bacterium]|nr:hypothetical protein [Verrucomicrobiales bacterium]|tara:strand:+ start:5965 stop:6597 length:633 start_codon:yes stop_codon:yes gene_type:complete
MQITSLSKDVIIEVDSESIETTQELRLRQIVNLLSIQDIKNTIRPLIEGKHSISLRLIDFLCVNYSRKKPVCYRVTLNTGHQVLWNLHHSYREWLKCWRRKNFDVFRRRSRIFVLISKEGIPEKIETTCGQLNFMVWLVQYNIIDYCMQNKKIIEQDMVRTLQQAKEKLRNNERKRREHITEATCMVNIYKTQRNILFDNYSDDDTSVDA